MGFSPDEWGVAARTESGVVALWDNEIKLGMESHFSGLREPEEASAESNQV